jgi:hypothetical protein
VNKKKDYADPPHPIDVKTSTLLKAQELSRMVKEHQQYGHRPQKV